MYIYKHKNGTPIVTFLISVPLTRGEHFCMLVYIQLYLMVKAI